MDLSNFFYNNLGKELASVEFPAGINTYKGKVRDCVINRNGTRTIFTTDRLSAFDRQICLVPFKGQILNQMSTFWLKKSSHIIENHLIETPHPNCVVCKEVEIIPVEIIVRKFLAGSAWRDYQQGKAISGIVLPPGLKQNDELPEMILTPSTKAEIGGHDEPISEKEILDKGIVGNKLWSEIKEKAFELFKFGESVAKTQGLTLVDTKYELGLADGKLVLADELHTPDSSRYWLNGKMLDKEFVREKLMSLGYKGDGEVPELSKDFITSLGLRYAENFKLITGEEFVPTKVNSEELTKLAVKYNT